MGYRDSGFFIPSTQIWDSSQVENIEGISPELKELFIRMYQNLNSMALAVNAKDTGIYHTDEFVTGQVFPPDPDLTSASNATPVQRPVYRKVINFGALPTLAAPGPSKTVAHELDLGLGFTPTRIYGCAYEPNADPALCNCLPLPYASPTDADNIELSIVGPDVVVTVGVDRSMYKTCWIILEYLKI